MYQYLISLELSSPALDKYAAAVRQTGTFATLYSMKTKVRHSNQVLEEEFSVFLSKGKIEYASLPFMSIIITHNVDIEQDLMTKLQIVEMKKLFFYSPLTLLCDAPEWVLRTDRDIRFERIVVNNW